MRNSFCEANSHKALPLPKAVALIYLSIASATGLTLECEYLLYRQLCTSGMKHVSILTLRRPASNLEVTRRGGKQECPRTGAWRSGFTS